RIAGNFHQVGKGDIGMVTKMRHRPAERLHVETVPELMVGVERIQPALRTGIDTELESRRIDQGVAGAAEIAVLIAGQGGRFRAALTPVADPDPRIVEMDHTDAHASTSLSGTCR